MKILKTLKTLFAITLITLTIPATYAQLIISQYYEGASNDKWIELLNSSEETIDFETSNFSVGLWRNADSEGYKTNLAPDNTLLLTGALGGGETLLIGHGSAANPGYATADIVTSGVTNFNGNDSLGIYTGEVFATANLIDAIGFTENGNEGQDTSFVRLSTTPGYNTEADSQVNDFSDVWNEVSIETVNNASVGQNERLGVTDSLATIPEPSVYTIALASVALGASLRRHYHRKKRSKSVVHS